MHLSITHTTRYDYDAPVQYAMQQVRLTPKVRPAQIIINWQFDIDGGHQELQFEDQHRNTVLLVALEAGRQDITITCTGEVETTDTNGIVGEQRGFAPLWYFRRTTDLTMPGPNVHKLTSEIDVSAENTLGTLHTLSRAISAQVNYEAGMTNVGTTAERALETGKGVCQDHVHVFLSAARLLGFPARYVSGYLMMNDRVDQDATHAWAEAYIDDLGWVGFDVSNAISPDERYVCAATGLDYAEAAPVSGMRHGDSGETLCVSVQVQQ